MAIQVLLLFLTIFTGISNALPPTHNTLPKLIYQYPNQTRIENLSVRSNGHLLLTTLTSPSLLTINPFSPHPTSSLIHRFPTSTSTFGIAELERDIFAVVVGNITFAPTSFSVWTVNLRSRTPVVRKAADIPGSGTLNGLARLRKNVVLGTDVLAGVVRRVDLRSGGSEVVLEDETMKAPLHMPGFAINGIRVRGRYVYYVNMGKRILCRVPIDLKTGTATGGVEIVSDDVGGADDFGLSGDGRMAYVADFIGSNIVRVRGDGEAEVIADGDGEVPFIGPTSARVGLNVRDRGVVYVVTSGAVFNPDTGSFDTVEGGKVLAVKH